MPGPTVHQWPPLLQQIRSVVCRLDLVGDGRCEGTLRKIPSETLLAGPIAEAGTEAVGGRKSPS